MTSTVGELQSIGYEHGLDVLGTLQGEVGHYNEQAKIIDPDSCRYTSTATREARPCLKCSEKPSAGRRVDYATTLNA
jgi:hypothetical protein